MCDLERAILQSFNGRCKVDYQIAPLNVVAVGSNGERGFLYDIGTFSDKIFSETTDV